MIKDDFAKIGLKFTKGVNYNMITIEDWEKFFPLIDLPTEGPLVEFAKHWHTLVTNYERHTFYIVVRVCGTSVFYYKNRYKSDITTETVEDSLEIYCPYNENDVRRYLWLNKLSQFDYTKICNDILKTLISIIEAKDD